MYEDGGSVGNLLEEVCDVRVAHADAAVACGGAELGLVVGAVNVDVAVAGVGVVGIEAVEPEDACLDEVGGVVRVAEMACGDAACEDGAEGGAGADFLGDLEAAEGGFEAALACAEAELGGGDGVVAGGVSALEGEGLAGDGDVDGRGLHWGRVRLCLRPLFSRSHVVLRDFWGVYQQVMSSPLHVAIVGATGAVGVELLKVLSRRGFPVGRLTLLASARSAGKRLEYEGEEVEVRELREDSFAGVDIALFSAGGSISKHYAPLAVQAGAVVVDNSSAFRMDENVPLVVPEINGADVKRNCGIIANPNCTTAITLMGLWPLHRAFGVKRVIAASYQAVSGTGAQAIEELRKQVEALAAGEEPASVVYPHQIAFNVLPHVDAFLETGYTKEEMKMQNEGRRIMHHPAFRASVTCVRVPVYRAHSVAVHAEFEAPVSLERAREVLAKAPGLRLVDNPALNEYPLPLLVAGKDECEIGRLRLDCALDNGIAFWIAGDQLLKGAALNAVQIAELV